MKYHLNPPSAFAALPLLLAASLASPAFAAESIVPAAGTYLYSQNFNGMAIATAAGSPAVTPNWADNGTIPNWWFHYTSNAAATSTGVFGGTSFAHNGGDGSVAPALTLVSQGAANNSDRAFATPSTTARCEQSGIVVFQNNGTKSVDLTRIQYNGEVLRTNSGANAVESVFPYYRIGDSQSALLTMTTSNLTGAQAAAAFPPAVSTTPTAGYFLSGWTSVPSAIWTYSNAAAASPVSVTVPVDANGLTGIRVPVGKFIALRFSNINDANTDALLGIDDLNLTFTEVNAAVSASVSNVVRNDNGTPLVPGDDTMEFRLTVTGSGSVGATWTVASPASIATTAPYGFKDYTGVPIGDFTGALHQLTSSAADTGNPSVNASFTVTAPWCAITTVSASGFAYADGGTQLDPSDDSVTYLGAATGIYTGATFNVTGASAAASAAYGSSASLSSTSGAINNLTFTDGADATCTASLVVNNAGIIGANNLSGSAVKLLSLPVTGTRRWALDSTARTATQTSATQVDHVVDSEIVDLTAVGGVVVTAHLKATPQGGGSTSGFEAADSFAMQVIVDGGAPVSFLGAADSNSSGRLEGNAALGTELPGATAPATDVRDFDFSYVVPPSANSLQVRFIGNSNSPGETLVVSNITLSLAPPALLATAGTVTNNNHGTDSTLDDTVDVPVTINPINLGASTGWGSNLTAPDSPTSGLYSAANPVTFSLAPPVLPATSRSVILHDVGDPSKTASLTITPIAPTLVATVTAGSIVRQDNGAGLADDTVTFTLNVSGNAGPHYMLAADIGTVTAPDYSLTSTATPHTVTLSPAPTHGTVIVAVRDVSYPALLVNVAVAVPAPAVPATQYVLGQKDLGGGLSDVVTVAGTPATAWYNYPGLRKTVNTNGGATAAIITSEVIDLSAVNGDVQLTATLRGVDRSAGFEAGDTFGAELIFDGVVATPVNLITAYDANASGLMNGGAGAADDEFNAAHLQDGTYTATFALNYLIPNSVNNVQLVFRGGNDSNNETFIVENVLFALTGPVDTDGDGMSDAYETANGLNPGSNADRDTDLDADGATNYQEFLAGTAANDPASLFKIVSSGPNGANYDVTFTSVAGKTYQVQLSSALSSWAPQGGTIAGTGSNVTVSIPASAFGDPLRGFLQVVVVP